VADPNLDLLVAAATVLKPMLPELVFVGGCATGLLITDPAMSQVRATIDVDVIVEVTSYVGYTQLSDRLRTLGLSADQDASAPLCRWKHGELRIDVMPLEELILGFSNKWYQDAIETAEPVDLAPGLSIKVINAPCFVATKLEAFNARGEGAFLGSHDLEDVISVIDGREILGQEILNSRQAIQHYIKAEFERILRSRKFIDALPGMLGPDTASQDRAGTILARMQFVADGGTPVT
jgi:predicted nucleotidyltransferase